MHGSSYYWNFRTSSFKQVACLTLKLISHTPVIITLFTLAYKDINVYGSAYYWNFRTSSFKQVAYLILVNNNSFYKLTFHLLDNHHRYDRSQWRLLPLQSSSKILPDLFLPLSILFLFRSILSVSKIANSFSTNWVKSSSCALMSISIKSGSSAVLLLKSPSKQIYL